MDGASWLQYTEPEGISKKQGPALDMQGHGFSRFPEPIPDAPQAQGAGDMDQIAWHEKQHMPDGQALPFKRFSTFVSRGQGYVFKRVYQILSNYHQFNPKGTSRNSCRNHVMLYKVRSSLKPISHHRKESNG